MNYRILVDSVCSLSHRVKSSWFGCQTIFCRIVHFLCCQGPPHWRGCLHPQAGLALPRSLAGSSFLAASAHPPESCFVGDKGNLEHGTILCGGAVGPVVLSVAMCAGSQPRALRTWTWCWAGLCWPWHMGGRQEAAKGPHTMCWQ